MTTKTLLSLALVSLFAATAGADSISAGTSTNAWFAVVASSATISGSGWTVPETGGTATADGTYINVDTAANNPLKYALPIDQLSATGIVIEGVISSLTRNATTPIAFSETLPQAAIAASDADDKWYVWHCTAADNGEWVATTTTAPSDGSTVNVVIEFVSGNVRYGIVGNDSTTYLQDTSNVKIDANGWLSNAKNFTAIANVGLAGYGSFGNFDGMVVKSITIDGSKIPASYGTVTQENINTKSSESAKLTIGQALVLGMANPTDDPIPAPVQTDDGNLGFTIGNANVGAYGTTSYATLEVYEVDSPDASIAAATPTATGTVGDTVKLPAKSTGVKYYKMKIKFH